MRRLFFVLVLAAFAIGGAFAQVSVHISAGGGFVFDGGRIGGDSFSEQGFSQSLHMNASGFGGFFFLDMTYAELSIGLMTGPLRHHWELIGLGQNVRTSEGGYLLTRADISLLGKIPSVLDQTTLWFFRFLVSATTLYSRLPKMGIMLWQGDRGAQVT